MLTDRTSTIETSLEIVQEERCRTVWERDAFSEFATTVGSFDTSPMNTANSRTNPLLVGPQQTDTRKIKHAYQESVMSVPHYEEEYNETLAVNLRAEFGPEIAATIINNNPVTPQIQRAVTAAATTAQKERIELISTLDTERIELKAAYRTLSEVSEMFSLVLNYQLNQQSFGELYYMHQQLIQGQSQCREILHDRQTQRQTGHARTRFESVPDLQNYLYQKLSVTYPILSSTLRLYDDLRSGRNQLEYWLARCD